MRDNTLYFEISSDYHMILEKLLKYLYVGFFLLTLPTLILGFSHSALSATGGKSLHTRFSEVSESYYTEATKQLQGTIYIKKNIKSLQKEMVRLVKNNEHSLANIILLKNFALVLDNIHSKITPYFLQHLLDQDIWSSGNTLALRALEQGSTFTVSRVHYLLGEYFFDRSELEKSFQHLTAIKSSEALKPNQRDYATIMFGISLQQRKDHRKALKFYERIEKDSLYYSYAKLNAAVANIRQGWWTDAQIAIESALAQQTPPSFKEITNRLILVMGYSQLQNEFYRNARKTFRKISLDSRYANKALLGIGLCALKQKDYGGALNAFIRLQNSSKEELSTIEAYLLVPYSYDRMGDLDQASILYSEAIAYFERKILDLELIKRRYAKNNGVFSKQELEIASTILAQKYRRLHEFDLTIASASLQKRIAALKIDYQREIVADLENDTEKTIDAVKSYMSQSQYGLAKLYDNQ